MGHMVFMIQVAVLKLECGQHGQLFECCDIMGVTQPTVPVVLHIVAAAAAASVNASFNKTGILQLPFLHMHQCPGWVLEAK